MSTVTPVARGSANVTVTATDPSGLSVTQTFAVNVVNVVNNRAPQRSKYWISSMTLRAGGASSSIDVASYVSDPDGDPTDLQCTLS